MARFTSNVSEEADDVQMHAWETEGLEGLGRDQLAVEGDLGEGAAGEGFRRRRALAPEAICCSWMLIWAVGAVLCV